tara:strand:+ start:36 stop:383 length:348 start_codon:yes stop_codon:yes gene_type:complete
MKESLIVLVLLSIMSCASYQPSNEYNFVKVLGVTVEGDTILVDIDLLRPKVYNNYYYDNGINRYPYNYYNQPRVVIPVYKAPKRPKPTRPTTTRLDVIRPISPPSNLPKRKRQNN